VFVIRDTIMKELKMSCHVRNVLTISRHPQISQIREFSGKVRRNSQIYTANGGINIWSLNNLWEMFDRNDECFEKLLTRPNSNLALLWKGRLCTSSLTCEYHEAHLQKLCFANQQLAKYSTACTLDILDSMRIWVY
jgi:hypothetical protein